MSSVVIVSPPPIPPPPLPGMQIRRARRINTIQSAPVADTVNAAPASVSPIAMASATIPPVPAPVSTLPTTLPSLIPTATIQLNIPLEITPIATSGTTDTPTHTILPTYERKKVSKPVVKPSQARKPAPSPPSYSTENANATKIPNYLIALVVVSSIAVLLSIIIAIRYKMKNARKTEPKSTFPVKIDSPPVINSPNYSIARTNFSESIVTEPKQYLFAKTNLDQIASERRSYESVYKPKELMSLFDTTNASNSKYFSDYSSNYPPERDSSCYASNSKCYSDYSSNYPSERDSSCYQTNMSYSILSYCSTPISLKSDHYSDLTSTRHPETGSEEINLLYADVEFEDSLYSGSKNRLLYSRI